MLAPREDAPARRLSTLRGVASRKEEKERLRQERLERERAAQASSERRKRLGMIVAAFVAVAAVAAIVAVALGGGGGGGGGDDGGGGGGGAQFPDVEVPARKTEDLAAAAKAAGCVLSKPKNEGAGHVEEKVRYKSNPPTSGEHNPTPASDGVHETPAQTEQLVHALEHGRVIFQWSAKAPARVRGALKAVFDEDKAIVVLTQNATGMPYEVAATSWDKLLACRAYNDRVPDALRAFREENRLKAPEFVPNAE